MVTLSIILGILLVAVSAYAIIKVKSVKKEMNYWQDYWRKSYTSFEQESLKREDELRTKLEKEQKDNKFLMRRIVDQQNDMAILRKTMQ